MSETELKIMDKIWDNPEGVESKFIYAYFKEHNDYAVTTISTLLHRIINKGYLNSIRKGKHKIFIPLMSRDAYFEKVVETELCEIVKTVEDMMAMYSKKTKLSIEQVEKLKQLLREIRNS